MKVMVRPFKSEYPEMSPGFLITITVLTALVLFQPVSTVFACQPKIVKQAMVLVVEKDNGKTIAVHPGESVQITLPENATTGYRWGIDHYDQDIIESVSAESHYTMVRPGSGGEVAFVFRAIKAGTGTIELKLWRHWEGDSSVIHRYHLQLNVQP